MNANQSFCHHSTSTDQFLKSKISKSGIKCELGQNLISINKDAQSATFENTETGEKHERDYNNLYTILPCKPQQELLDAGLAGPNSNNLLDVDRETLRHNKYDNIFGLGDTCNLPTTKGFWSGFY